MSYRDYGAETFTQYGNAYVNEPKIKINLDKYAEDLYKWKNQQYTRNAYGYDERSDDKPQIEDYLVVINAPSTEVAKSSLKGR